MTGNAVAKKGTILIPSGPTKHLHFVCSDPVFYPRVGKECVLLVNISSINGDIIHDSTCELNVGDHPFITKPSYVYYKKAELFGSENIERNVAAGEFQIHAPCDEDVFKRILKGFDASDDVSRKVYNFYEKYCKL